MNPKLMVAVAVSLLVLAACGGGGGGAANPPPASDSVPDEASASTAAMKAWLASLAATAPEEKEALDVARFAPPQPNDTEPDPLQ